MGYFLIGPPSKGYLLIGPPSKGYLLIGPPSKGYFLIGPPSKGYLLIGTTFQGNKADVVITSNIGPGLAEIGMTVFRYYITIKNL